MKLSALASFASISSSLPMMICAVVGVAVVCPVCMFTLHFCDEFGFPGSGQAPQTSEENAQILDDPFPGLCARRHRKAGGGKPRSEFVNIRGVAPYLSDHKTRGGEVDFLAFDALVVGVREAFAGPLGIRRHCRIQRIGKRALSFSPQASADGGMMRAVAERMTKGGLGAARHPFMSGPIM